MKNFILSIAIGMLIVSSCAEKKEQVVSETEVMSLMNGFDQANNKADDLSFWTQKLRENPNSSTYLSSLAGAYLGKYNSENQIEDLHKSDSLFLLAIEKNPFSNASNYQALSINSITKHEFPDAKTYAELALAEGDKKSQSKLLLFDALMELGEFKQAKALLNQFTNKESFDYLVRASKMADHDGDLDTAIKFMEKALTRVINNPELSIWSESNLGDMYGHAGRISDSYKAFINVLAKQSNHWHSWQGIAWIAYAHDQNPELAQIILEAIEKPSKDPQVKLFLAELAEFQNDDSLSKTLKLDFLDETSAPKYLGMYNKYKIQLLSEDFNEMKTAIELAHQEQEKRPTPAMYDLLAWTYFQNGELEKALKLSALFVEGQSYEPEVIYHMGMIYLYNDQEEKGRAYLKEALESGYELGPLTIVTIREALKS